MRLAGVDVPLSVPHAVSRAGMLAAPASKNNWRKKARRSTGNITLTANAPKNEVYF
jgi:hypothetical protein